MLQLTALLATCSALPQLRQARSEVAPLVVWAEPQTSAGDHPDTPAAVPSSDLQSRFGLFAAQSETVEPDGGPVAVWPGPAWEKSGSPAAVNRSGEVDEAADQVASESARAAELARYVTRLTERQFSRRGELAFEGPPAPRGEDGRQDQAQDRSDGAGEAPQRGAVNRRGSDGTGEEDAKLSVLRQRRKKLRLSRLSAASGPSRLSVIRRQRPSASSGGSEGSEEQAAAAASERRDGAKEDITTEAPGQQRRPFGVRRQSGRRRPQRRRRPVKKAVTQTSTTATQRPNRRRRPTQPPTTTETQTTEQQTVTQSTHANAAQAVYFQPNPEEYPQYPPFAPQEPTQAQHQPLQPPQLESQGRGETPRSQQPPSQFANSLQQFSDSVRQLSGSHKRADDQDLSDKVSKLKLKFTNQKEVTDNDIPVSSTGKPATPRFRAEDVTTRPLRELFDVLTRSELAKGSRREDYGPADRETLLESPKQSIAASLFRAEVQKLQTRRPQVQTDRPPMRSQWAEAQTERLSVSHAASARRPQSQLSQNSSPSERVVPSNIVYEAGFEPITGHSHFHMSSASSFKASEPSVFQPPQPAQHTVQRPAKLPQTAPSRERKPATAGKVRFPGSVEPPTSSPSFARPPGVRPHPGPSPGRPGPASFGVRPSNSKPSRDSVRRPGARPFGGQSASDKRPSHSVRIAGPAPLQGTPNLPPLHQKHSRPPPFRTQQIQGSSPQSFRVRPQPPRGRPQSSSVGSQLTSGRPHSDLPNHPPHRAFSKERPQGPPFNQLPSRPFSGKHPPFSPPPPGQSQTGQFTLKARPHHRQPPRQVAEEPVQRHRPLAPPRGQRPPGPVGQQRPPNGFQQRPPTNLQRRPSHIGGQPRPSVGQQGPSSDQGKFQTRQQRPPFDFQQRPPGAGGPKRPPFGIQSRPSESTGQKRPPFGFQQRPPHGLPQGASGPAGFRQRVPPRLRPGARLPASAHPRNPPGGLLADLTRRSDAQKPAQLLLQRG